MLTSCRVNSRSWFKERTRIGCLFETTSWFALRTRFVRFDRGGLPRLGSLVRTPRETRLRPSASVPGRRVVHPAAGDHRRDDLRVEVEPRIAVEHDEVGGEAGKELAACSFLAGEPRRRDAGRVERLVDGQRLLLVPRGPVV